MVFCHMIIPSLFPCSSAFFKYFKQDHSIQILVLDAIYCCTPFGVNPLLLPLYNSVNSFSVILSCLSDFTFFNIMILSLNSKSFVLSNSEEILLENAKIIFINMFEKYYFFVLNLICKKLIFIIVT